MKGLILAGGAGTRLRPITYTSAKQLVPVANKPILFYGLEAMAEAGIKDVGVIVGDTAAEIKAAVGDGSRWALSVTYIPQEAPLGLAHCVLIARQFLGDDDFVMYLGDNLISQGVKQFVDRFEAERDRATAPTLADDIESPAAQILLARVSDPDRFGVAELDVNGTVVRLVEKPPVPASDLALVGVYLFDRTIHEAVRAIQPSARGELEITDAIQWLVDNGHHVRSEVLQGWWIDTGKLTPLLDANRLILETLTRRIDGEVDAGSQIDGRVVIEEGAVVGAIDDPRPGHHRRPGPHQRQLHRPVHRGRSRLRDRALGGGAFSGAGPHQGDRCRAARGLAPGPAGRGDPQPAPTPCHPAHGGRSLSNRSLLSRRRCGPRSREVPAGRYPRKP